jgi:hypothetical protein
MDHYQLTDDQQIHLMKNNHQANGQITGLSDKSYDFYKQIDIEDFLKYLKNKYHEHTAKCYHLFRKICSCILWFKSRYRIVQIKSSEKIMDITISKKIHLVTFILENITIEK